MEFYNEKDLEYWKRQAEKGKAIVLEIPVSMLLDLDIKSLSSGSPGKVKAEDLEKWMEENREEIMKALEMERADKEELARLQMELCEDGHVENGRRAQEKGDGNGESPIAAVPGISTLDAKQAVARIMAKEVFSEEQIAVIAEAMVEELPDRYLLCFLKKEYSPDIMRKLKNYCMKMYREEAGLK